MEVEPAAYKRQSFYIPGSITSLERPKKCSIFVVHDVVQLEGIRRRRMRTMPTQIEFVTERLASRQDRSKGSKVGSRGGQGASALERGI
jgi:hypothetical protein